MSKSTCTHKVVATVGTYVKDGQEKKRYLTVGAGFTDDQGRQSIKLDALPVHPEWSGWLSLYDRDDDVGERTATTAERPKHSAEGTYQRPANKAAQAQSDLGKDADGREYPF